jgi:hypothetical protein
MIQSGSRPAENMKVGCQSETLSRDLLEVISATRERVDFCLDYTGLSFLGTDGPLWKVVLGLVNKGLRSRFITKITRENTRSCTLLMKYNSEVFHDDKFKGNFVIVDGRKYIFYVIESKEDEERQRQEPAIGLVLYNEVKQFVEVQQCLFDYLCTNAIPARERIREIGKGIRGNFIDTIRNPSEIQKTAINLLESATYEILVLFSTINSFYRAEYGGLLNSLSKASQRSVMIKILIQVDDNNQLKETIRKGIPQTHLPIEIQYISKPLQNKVTTLVIDQAVS